MAKIQNYVQRSFQAGEVSPLLLGRADLALFGKALKTCRNFLVLPGGGVANRAGTYFCGATKNNAQVYLYRWAFSAGDQSTLLEVGDGYMRFWVGGEPSTVSAVPAYNGATAYTPGDVVSSGGTNYVCIADTTGNAPPNVLYWYALTGTTYEIPTPWPIGAFNSPGRVRASQNVFDVVMSHPGYAPRILANGNATGAGNPSWSLETLVTEPHLDAPTIGAATPGDAGVLNPAYKFTAVRAEDYEESLPSAAVVCATSAEPTDEAPNSIAFTAPTVPAGTTVLEYRAYKDPVGNGIYGFIGSCAASPFKDPGYLPDFNLTPPQARSLFATALNYPELCAHYQQRRLFAYTDNDPATLFGSQIAHLTNFSLRSPLQDDDAVTFKMLASELNVIRHIIPLKRLVILTDGGEWVALGDESGGITPSAFNLDQHGYVGADRATPTVVGNTALYVQRGGERVRAASFLQGQSQDELGTDDLSTIADHLFEGMTIQRLEYQKSQHTVWALRSDGALLGLTYRREDQTVAWHRHDTAGGTVEDICVVPELGGDVLYLVVNRTINGGTKRYIEQLQPRLVHLTNALLETDAFFVDCGLTYDGAPADIISGLDHLEGEAVIALADGVERGPFTVASGAITLPAEASVVHVGKAITAQIEPVNLDAQGTDVLDKGKRVQSVGLLLHASGPGVDVGPDADNLVPLGRATWEDASDILTGYSEAPIPSEFTKHGRCLVQHTSPTPLTILALVPRFEFGG